MGDHSHDLPGGRKKQVRPTVDWDELARRGCEGETIDVTDLTDDEYTDRFVNLITEADALPSIGPMSSEAYDERLKAMRARLIKAAEIGVEGSTDITHLTADEAFEHLFGDRDGGAA